MGNTSLIINDNEIRALKNTIVKNKLKTTSITNAYEVLRVKDDDINLILYKSGKLVYNSNITSKNFLKTILEKEKDYDYILGSDEAGKGEWYGPLVTVAAALTPDDIIEVRLLGIKDSKTIKKAQIIKLANKIIEMAFNHESIILKPKTYNKLYEQFHDEGKSLNDIMAWTHSKVIQELLHKIEFDDAKIIIDKFDYNKTKYRLKSLDQTHLKLIQKTKAESEIPVATASILAKYFFEKTVDELNEKYDINLRDSNPEDLNSEIISEIAKIHFKNVPH